MATLEEWLSTKREGVPDTLWQQVDMRVAASAQDDVDALAGLYVTAQVQMTHMRELSCAQRTDALDLLTTDACVTYLLELAAESHPDALGVFAGQVLRMIAEQESQGAVA